jgi:hypothetical protein
MSLTIDLPKYCFYKMVARLMTYHIAWFRIKGCQRLLTSIGKGIHILVNKYIDSDMYMGTKVIAYIFLLTISAIDVFLKSLEVGYSYT